MKLDMLVEAMGSDLVDERKVCFSEVVIILSEDVLALPLWGN